MTPQHLAELFARDIKRLDTGVEAYPTDEALWNTSGSVKNPGGTLCLHLCGNLRHFVGHVLGGLPYTRDRAHEFGARGLTKAELLAEVESTQHDVAYALARLAPELLEAPYPVRVLDREWNTGSFLLHLYGHLNYHLGQLDYHRRMIDA
jgi:hypothetical protein